ncbi:hypothetical protein FALCPG4_011483 [Fusarium falciforme]
MSIRPTLQPPRPFGWYGEFTPLTSSEAEPTSPDYTVVSSVLCLKCEAIRSWAQTNLSKREAVERPLPQTHIRHHDSGTDLLDSYASGCHLCTLIWWSFLGSFPERSPDLWIREVGPIGVREAVWPSSEVDEVERRASNECIDLHKVGFDHSISPKVD